MTLRIEDQSDFDLERVMDMFDTALTSNDPRVQNALRSLLTIVALTQTQEDGGHAVESSVGPLRRMQQDIRNLTQSISRLHNELQEVKRGQNPYSNTGSPWGVHPPGSPYALTGGQGPTTLSCASYEASPKSYSK